MKIDLTQFICDECHLEHVDLSTKQIPDGWFELHTVKYEQDEAPSYCKDLFCSLECLNKSAKRYE